MTNQTPFRAIPDLPWQRVLLATVLLATVAFGAWEFGCRRAGYTAGLDDTADLWADARRRVTADATVLVGSSRGLFGLDLDLLEGAFGKRPVQLALVGSNPLPVLLDLAEDESFRGEVILDLVPSLLLVPEDSPPYQNAAKAVLYARSQNPAQRLGQALSLPLQRTLACLQQEDLTLAALLGRLAVPDRAGTQVPPALPPYFYTTDADRRARMTAAVEQDPELRARIQQGWLPLFTPPPPPRWVDAERFGAAAAAMVEQRFADLERVVARLQARGCRVVFLRMPTTQTLRELEAQLVPRAIGWERTLRECRVPGVHFEDHAELAGFACPEWSHLTDRDATEFTRRLLPHLQRALAAAQAGSADAMAREVSPAARR